MTAVLSGLTQPIEQESLLHRKPASRTTVRVPTGTRQPYPQGQNRQSVFLKFAGMVLTIGAICENIILIALAMLVLSDKKQEIVEEYDHVKR